jgi:hypothetical protein
MSYVCSLPIARTLWVVSALVVHHVAYHGTRHVPCCRPPLFHGIHASQVLSDVDKRNIYDVYGRLGLQAGLALGSKSKSIEELRAQWQQFQNQAQQVRVATEIAPATQILVESNAVSLISSMNFEQGSSFVPILGMYYEPIWPVITAGALYHTCSFNFSESCSLAVGGEPPNYLVLSVRNVSSAFVTRMHKQIAIACVLWTNHVDAQVIQRTVQVFTVAQLKW